jgi:hypothetical protein
VIYDTRIGIEIAEIRRSVWLEFKYRVDTENCEDQLVHEAITLLADEGGRIPADWIELLLGPRQRKELESRLLKYWKARNRVKRSSKSLEWEPAKNAEEEHSSGRLDPRIQANPE